MTPMEELLSGMTEATIVQALQSLLPSLLSNWNNPEGFRRAATPGFMREAGIPRADAAKAVAVVDQARRQVLRLRGVHFRPFTTDDDLEFAYTKIVPTSANSPTMQGSLWLAFQAQRSAISYLDAKEGAAAKLQVVKAVDDNKAVFQALASEAESLTLPQIERILVTIGRKVLDEKTGDFNLSVITGYIIETGRREARNKQDGGIMASEGGRLSEEVRMLATVIEPVHKAELNEASQRFMRLKDTEKAQRFDRLREYMNRHAQQVGKMAPAGYEKFCQAVESQLFPYPAQIEWMRSYLKPLYANAQQSSLFDNCLTEASIRQRYEKVMSEKNSNTSMVEMARAFALAKLSRLEDPGQRDFLERLDLREEFNWPGSLEELKAQQKA